MENNDTHVVSRKVFALTNFLFDIVLIVALCLVSFNHFILVNVPTESMVPTLKVGCSVVGQYVSGADLTYDDIAMFFADSAPSEQIDTTLKRFCFQTASDQVPLIKRVVGLAGDVIEVKDGYAYRNGEMLPSDYPEAKTGGTFGPYVVPEGCIFMMGDNRNCSVDSRIYGAIPEISVFGKATFILPFSAVS